LLDKQVGIEPFASRPERAISTSMTHQNVFYGIFGIGILLGAIRIGFIMFRLKINEVVFVNAIQKLVGANNLERAVKLCRAAPSAISARGTAAMLVAFQNKVTDSVALREEFDRSLGGLNKAAGKLGILPWLGLALALVGAAWAHLQGYDFMHPVYRPGVVALVVSTIGIQMGAKIKNKTAWTRDEMIRFLQEQSLKT